MSLQIKTAPYEAQVRATARYSSPGWSRIKTVSVNEGEQENPRKFIYCTYRNNTPVLDFERGVLRLHYLIKPFDEMIETEGTLLKVILCSVAGMELPDLLQPESLKLYAMIDIKKPELHLDRVRFSLLKYIT